MDDQPAQRSLPLLFDQLNRPLPRRAVLALMANSAAAAFLAACSSTPAATGTQQASAAPTPASTSAPSVAPAATAAASSVGAKTVIIGNSEGNPEHLDLLLTPAFVTRQNAGPCHGFLANLGVDGSIGPEVASAWEVVDDTHIRFTIRDDITFHNGRTLVSDDVRKTYEHLLKPETGSSFRGFDRAGSPGVRDS